MNIQYRHHLYPESITTATGYSTEENLEFQVISWFSLDQPVSDHSRSHGDQKYQKDGDDEDEEEENDALTDSFHLIKIFGVTRSGGTVSATVTGYRPEFYVKVPPMGSQSCNSPEHLGTVKETLQLLIKLANKRHFGGRKNGGLVDYRIVQRKTFWGFTNGMIQPFIRLIFNSHDAMRGMARFLDSNLIYVRSQNIKLDCFESNIEPFLRFMHKRGLDASGWVCIPAGSYTKGGSVLSSNKQMSIDVTVPWKSVRPVVPTEEGISPLLIAAFDIECNSSHGDFPVATKTYVALASEIYEWYAARLSRQDVPSDFDAKSVMISMISYALGIDNEDDRIRMEKMGANSINRVFLKNGPLSEMRASSMRSTVIPAVVDDIFCVLSGKNHRIPRALRADDESTGPDGSPDGGAECAAKQAAKKREKKKSLLAKATETLEKAQQREDMKQTQLKLMDGGTLGLDRSRCRADAETAKKKEAPLNAGAKTAAIVKLLEKAKFPLLEGDEIIQIGTTFHRYGEQECCYRHIVTLGQCEAAENADTVSCKTEREVILEWARMIHRLDPDIVTGYNVFGFDYGYIIQRAHETGVEKPLLKHLSRLADIPSTYVEKNLSSSAMGENLLRYFEMPGRTIFDLYKLVQKEHKLDSHSLDNVAKHFLGLQKNDVSPSDIFRLQKGGPAEKKTIADYCLQDCALCNRLIIKLEIVANNMGMANVCSVPLGFIFMRGQGVKIFSLVARQCLTDGFLLPTLEKPMSEEDKLARIQRFKRQRGGSGSGFGSGCGPKGSGGQSAHTTHKSWVEEDAEAGEGEEGEGLEDTEKYEGAIVLDPEVGIYAQDPVTVLDYASLYPSSIISENISPDSLVMDHRFDNLPGVDYVTIAYDTPQGECKCRFAQVEGKSVLPRILMTLLAQRKKTRKRITHKAIDLVASTGETVRGAWDDNDSIFHPEESTRPPFTPTAEEVATLRNAYNGFQVAVLDGLQNAYKVTANSLYGQMGARTSPIYLKHVAASTTAVGRNLILTAKAFMETHCGARVIYGDTDSLFMTFQTFSKDGKRLQGHDALAPSMEKAREASARFKPHLKAPHDMEYEKTFWPFIIFSKKRYVGNLYEDDPNKFKFKSMGIVLKRRDNAPILKIVYGGIVDILLNKHDLRASVEYLKSSLDDIATGNTPVEQLIITKTLRARYKNPEGIAHNVLAQRIGERDPGNKPQSNDRIPFVFIHPPPSVLQSLPPGKSPLQGDCIEDPQYIIKHGLKIDYKHYITNQIMKPVLQLFAVLIEQIEGYTRPKGYWEAMKKNLEEMYDMETDKQAAKLTQKLFEAREVARSRLAQTHLQDDDCAFETEFSKMTDKDIEFQKMLKIRSRDEEKASYVSKKYDSLREEDAKRILFEPVLKKMETIEKENNAAATASGQGSGSGGGGTSMMRPISSYFSNQSGSTSRIGMISSYENKSKGKSKKSPSSAKKASPSSSSCSRQKKIMDQMGFYSTFAKPKPS